MEKCIGVRYFFGRVYDLNYFLRYHAAGINSCSMAQIFTVPESEYEYLQLN